MGSLLPPATVIEGQAAGRGRDRSRNVSGSGRKWPRAFVLGELRRVGPFPYEQVQVTGSAHEDAAPATRPQQAHHRHCCRARRMRPGRRGNRGPLLHTGLSGLRHSRPQPRESSGSMPIASPLSGDYVRGALILSGFHSGRHTANHRGRPADSDPQPPVALSTAPSVIRTLTRLGRRSLDMIRVAMSTQRLPASSTIVRASASGNPTITSARARVSSRTPRPSPRALER